MKNINSFVGRIIAFAGSNPFFWCVVGLLVLQAAWIAFTGRYPMAFDEDFHLGVIKLYAHHPSPFWEDYVAGGDAFGAVARDPSYLSHLLMSFPFRFISNLTDNLHTQVVLLRLMNVAFFAGGLIIYRRLLLKTGVSKQIAHLSLLILVLLPVTPLLAAQINYDNILIPLVGVALLLTIKLIQSSNKKALNLQAILYLLLVCFTASIIKYAFLPIFLVIIFYTTVILWRRYASVKQFKIAFLAGYKQIGKFMLIGLIAANLLIGTLVVERYGVNIARYQKPVADCGEVLSYENCKHYGPWIRDYRLSNQPNNASSSPIAFSYEWLHGMWFRTFFAVDGPSTRFQTRGPLTTPGVGGILFGVVGLVAFAFSAKRIWSRYDTTVLWLITLVSLGYLSILWLDEYQMYLETGKAVAINGRYLLPVMPFMIMFGVLGVRELLSRHSKIQLSLACGVILCLIWGGGALTYILRSNDAWYWQSNQTVNSVNRSIIRNVGPITPGFYSPSQFSP